MNTDDEDYLDVVDRLSDIDYNLATLPEAVDEDIKDAINFLSSENKQNWFDSEKLTDYFSRVEK